ASCTTTSKAPRDWHPDEIALLEEVAERLFTRIERARGDAALRESEGKYRTLFDTIDEGYCVMEVIRGADGRAIDLVAREVNRAWENKTGIPDPLNRRMSELLPNLEEHWLPYYDSVVRTGVPHREENYMRDVDRWFSAHYSLVGDLGSNLVAVV